MRIAIGCLAACLLVSSVCFAQTPTPHIFDRTILAQPFDNQPFREIRIPAWVQDTIGCGYTLSVMDTAARQRAVKHGVTISEMGFVSAAGAQAFD